MVMKISILPLFAAGLIGHTAGAQTIETHTGKERLGDKWQDEQRVDNCKVPEGLRGVKPRPDCVDKDAPLATSKPSPTVSAVTPG